jgi:hypothetical protein
VTAGAVAAAITVAARVAATTTSAAAGLKPFARYCSASARVLAVTTSPFSIDIVYEVRQHNVDPVAGRMNNECAEKAIGLPLERALQVTPTVGPPASRTELLDLR